MIVNDFEIMLRDEHEKHGVIISSESCIRVYVNNPVLGVSDEYYGYFYGVIHRIEPFDDDYLILIDECACCVYIPSSNISDVDIIDTGDEDELE